MKWMYAIMMLTCASIAAGVAVKHDSLAAWLIRGSNSGMTNAELDIAHRDAMARLTAEPVRPELTRSMFMSYGSNGQQPVIIVGDHEEATRRWNERMARIQANAESPIRSAGRMATAHVTSQGGRPATDESIDIDSRLTDRLNSEGKTIFQNSRFGAVSDYNLNRRRSQFRYRANRRQY